MPLPSIEDLNNLPFDKFFEPIHLLFEPAPPLAQALYAKIPFQSYQDLIDQAEKCISMMNLLDKFVVINAHPRIGAPKQTLSPLSLKEQGYEQSQNNPHSNTGTSIITQQQQQRHEEAEKINQELARLNELYENKFGFKFVIFVNGRSRAEIIPALKERMESHSKVEELEIGLRDMMLIARDRLKKQKIGGLNKL